MLVTGANRGIGKELVRQLREKGHQVILSARVLDKAQAAAGEIGGGVEAIELDVADSETSHGAPPRFFVDSVASIFL